jgi:hypothetical protein
MLHMDNQLMHGQPEIGLNSMRSMAMGLRQSNAIGGVGELEARAEVRLMGR